MANNPKQEVSDMLGGRISNQDEDEVEEELAALEAEVAAKNQPQPAVPVQPVPQVPLPNVPDTELPSTPSRAEEERQQQRQRQEERQAMLA